ncbi:MAG: hypothetical protein H6718_11450 [Polyangiaceae bacterium]|nr:hypothetical protein [Myxococcales bacterium]MCB9586006.1 hypothetical protein [Polyangiaceae bacterium]
MGRVGDTPSGRSNWFALSALLLSACAQSTPPPSEPSGDPAATQPEVVEAPPTSSPTETPPPSSDPEPEPEPEGQLTGVGEVGSGSGKRCSVKDDNGPLPGGNITASGCDAGETCRCESQAGYSCSGVCVK